MIPPRAGTRRLDKVILWLAVASLIGAWLWLILGTSSHHAASVPSGLTSAAARGNNAPSAKLMAKGRSVYAQQCAGCHQVSGKGVPGAFPPLANNPNLQDVDLVIDSVVRGKSGPVTVEGGRYDSTMPAFGDRLSNTEIAAVVTFTRNALGNHYGGTDPGQVASRR